MDFFKGLYYNFHGGFTCNQVALYKLNKKNKSNYLSEFDWYKSRKINYPYSYMLNNKLIFADLIKDYISIPQTLFACQKGIIKNEKTITLEEAIGLLKNHKCSFYKPTSAGKGNNVHRIDYTNKKFYIDLKEVLVEDVIKLLRNTNDYFVSVGINQAEYLRKMYDKTTNTIRLVTVRDKGKIKVLCAVQRIGTEESIPVDNGSRGGLIANIDLKSGQLSEARSLHNNNVYEKHPDSNSRIKGVIIPNWNKITSKIVSVAEKLDKITFIAWDILPTDDDIYVIEGNSSSGINIFQVFGGQRNKELGDFYRSQKIIK